MHRPSHRVCNPFVVQARLPDQRLPAAEVGAGRSVRRKSAAPSTAEAGHPEACGVLHEVAVPERDPESAAEPPHLFSAMATYRPSTSTATTKGAQSRTAVSSSWEVMRRPPSPVTATTLRCGLTSFAAIGPGTAMPIVASPLAMITVFGRRAAGRVAARACARRRR